MQPVQIAVGTLLFSIILIVSCKKEDDPIQESKYIVSTIAGNNLSGYVDGPANVAQLGYPSGMAIDHSGNIFFSDIKNKAVRKISSNGIVSTLAGGTYGTDDGQGINAKFLNPRSITIDSNGVLYLIDSEFTIRKITADGMVTTFAGRNRGSTDGLLADAEFSMLTTITLDQQGNLFLVDNGIEWGHGVKIRKINNNGIVSTLSNEGNLSAKIVMGNAGDIYTAGFPLLKFTSSGIRSTIIEMPPVWTSVNGLARDKSGNFYFSSIEDILFTHSTCQIFKIDISGKIEAIAGTGIEGFEDGDGHLAKLFHPHNVTIDYTDNLYFIDNYRIRKLSHK